MTAFRDSARIFRIADIIGYIDLREVGPPPNTKRRQNSLNRLCSVCAGLCCKKIVCAALFF